jgi:membrane-associated phospholipid phosphatase
MSAWIEALARADGALFHFINDGLSNPLFDLLLPLFREKLFWAPFYLFVGAFVWFNFRRQFWAVLLGAALCTTLSDSVSSRLVKPAVARIRPCNDAARQSDLRLRVAACGAGYSFTSSHAANHFAAAVFLSGLFGTLHRRIRPALYAWAASVALAQVYVGVHYPADVIGGAVLGSVLGGWVLYIWRSWVLYPPVREARE